MFLNSLLQLDIAIFRQLNNLPHGVFFDSLATLLHYGTRGALIYVPLLVILLVNKNTRHQAYIAIIACLSTTVIVDLILKPLIHRLRPFSALSMVNLLPPVPTSFSFPSSETALAFAVAMICNLLLKNKWWRLLWVWSVIVAFSRIYMGHHYPSDVLAGAIIGTGISYIVYRLTNQQVHTKPIFVTKAK